MIDEERAIALKLLVVLYRAQAAVNARMLENAGQLELTPGEFSVLEALYHKGPQLLNEVQRRVLVSSGGITFLVDRLQKKGLVERRDCASDRRARYAVLTQAGGELIERIFPDHADSVKELMSALTPTEQREATRLLKKLGVAAASGSKAKT
jgi:MarR family 2-MHQ and catechol resistance regulon transcriptional repressor